MRPFWLRPKWIVGHVLVLVLVVTFINLGFWQLRRLDQKQARNATIADRTSQPVTSVEDLLEPGGAPSLGRAVEWRRVVARGRYDAAGTVLVRNRSLNGQPGEHVLTPLVLDDGSAVLVNRGWVPYAVDDPSAVIEASEPPEREVEVTGLLTAGQERGRFGPTDPATGRLRQIVRADIGRVQAQYERSLLPAIIQLRDQRPPQTSELPVVLPDPEQDEGPHLSYAVQWFLFAAIGAVGWPLLLRHTARDVRAAGPDPTDGGATGPFGPSWPAEEAVAQPVSGSADRTGDERSPGPAGGWHRRA